MERYVNENGNTVLVGEDALLTQTEQTKETTRLPRRFDPIYLPTAEEKEQGAFYAHTNELTHLRVIVYHSEATVKFGKPYSWVLTHERQNVVLLQGLASSKAEAMNDANIARVEFTRKACATYKPSRRTNKRR